MLKVAILDDYQNVAQEFVDIKKMSGKYEIKVFSEPFENENDAIEQLKDFESTEKFTVSSLLRHLESIKF